MDRRSGYAHRGARAHRWSPGQVLGVRRVRASLKPLPGAKGKRGRQQPRSTSTPKSKACVRLPMRIGLRYRAVLLTLAGTFDSWHTTRGEPFWCCTNRAEGPRRLGAEVTGGLAYGSFDLQRRRVSGSRQASGASASGCSSAVTGAIVRGTMSRSAQGRSA